MKRRTLCGSEIDFNSVSNRNIMFLFGISWGESDHLVDATYHCVEFSTAPMAKYVFRNANSLKLYEKYRDENPNGCEQSNSVLTAHVKRMDEEEQ